IIKDYERFRGELLTEYELQKETGKQDGSGPGSGSIALQAKFKGKCRNCGKIRHEEEDCWSPRGGKEGKGPQQQRKREGNSNSSSNMCLYLELGWKCLV
ncbi:hypothetical protein HK405_009940, partial [Cladochytrium tenue]